MIGASGGGLRLAPLPRRRGAGPRVVGRRASAPARGVVGCLVLSCVLRPASCVVLGCVARPVRFPLSARSCRRGESAAACWGLGVVLGVLGFIALSCALCCALSCALCCAPLLGVVRRVWRACPRVALCVVRLFVIALSLSARVDLRRHRGVGILGGVACPLLPLLQFFPLRRSGWPGWCRRRAVGLPGWVGVVGWSSGVLSRLSTVLVDVAGRRVDAGWRGAGAWWLSRGSSWRVRVDGWRVDRERAAPGGLPGAMLHPSL